jgi:hypothetical protein
MTDKHPVGIAKQTKSAMVTNTTGKKKQKDVPIWLEELLSNNIDTPEELLALMQQVDGTPPFPAKATMSANETCLSPITDNSGNDIVNTDKFVSGNC